MRSKDFGLEGLRGVASLVVAIGHFLFVFFPYLGNLFTPIPGLKPRFPFEHWFQYPPFSLLYSAEAAVCVFFVMSGYVLSGKYFSTLDVANLQSAASKRYVRLVLPSFASVLLAWVLFKSGAIITAESPSLGVAGWVSSWYAGPFPFLHTLFDGLIGAPLFSHTALNPPLWTIQVELIGSIFLFSMLALFSRRPLWLAVWFLFFADVLGFSSPNVLFYISFLVGALLNPARHWLTSHQTLAAMFAALGLVGLAYNHLAVFAPLQAIHLPNLQPYGPKFDDNARLVWNSLGAMLFVAGVLCSHPLNKLFASTIPVFLGKISFSLYVIHVPLLMSVGLRAARAGQHLGLSFGRSAAVAFVVYLTVAIAAAALFRRLVDEPSIRLADRIGKGTFFETRASAAPVRST